MSTTISVETTDELREALRSSQAQETETGVVLADVEFPSDVNCFLIESGQDSQIGPMIESVARRSGRQAICCDLIEVSKLAADLLPDDVTLVAAGDGARDLACAWALPYVTQEIQLERDSRLREHRSPMAERVSASGDVVVFDDVVVRGHTLSAAVRQVVTDGTVGVVVGLAFASRTMRRLVQGSGCHRLSEVIRYRRAGGGRPPVNSLRTLQVKDPIRQSLAQRYFGSAEALDFLAERGCDA